MRTLKYVTLILFGGLAAIIDAVGGACAGWATGNKIITLWPPHAWTFTYRECLIVGSAALLLIMIGMTAMLKTAQLRKRPQP